MNEIIKQLKEILTSDDITTSINRNIDWLVLNIPNLDDLEKNDKAWNHTIKSLSLSNNDFIVRLTILLSNIGKNLIRNERKQEYTKNESLEVSYSVYKIMDSMGFDKDYIEMICNLINKIGTKVDNNIDKQLLLMLYELLYCELNADKIMLSTSRKKG